MTSSSYGTGDASYRAAGGADGIDHLVHRFYEHMETLPEAGALRGYARAAPEKLEAKDVEKILKRVRDTLPLRKKKVEEKN